MAAPPKVKPKWIIDTHGMREALSTSSNKIRAAVIDAIESGEMLLLKAVSDELKKLYPDLWDDFKEIKNKKYHATTVPAIHAASLLTEKYGASILGSVPTREHFQAVAVARILKCKLVSAGKALTNCQGICTKCGLPSNSAVSLDFVSSHA
ncbi:hypothetical protein [Rhizobium leguminosarum]|uniref:PIN domain-containing protein n=1 Tax=Rhizobium leguminosarum TaxID=384 RepID=A0ABD7PGV9_RHILE|nr:hypothetical protein [Rhizobium leguminosarum]TAV64355.1 hypothetical protein ELI28_31395 [Rhizobium leguminosarum]TAV66348.1 hypothetical protein ELI27_29145 [Rhizobium leguminosarum]TAW19274.1 hypothetical protein ELI19_29130 [Rhizobium leguminosarum]TAW33089.1 hypothetical protein ELI18_31385 [Rhizobium leguminosarum]TAZ23948.1 hypothetical protein ELH73_32515 [Rhizobium leguminosarum]